MVADELNLIGSPENPATADAEVTGRIAETASVAGLPAKSDASPLANLNSSSPATRGEEEMARTRWLPETRLLEIVQSPAPKKVSLLRSRVDAWRASEKPRITWTLPEVVGEKSVDVSAGPTESIVRESAGEAAVWAAPLACETVTLQFPSASASGGKSVAVVAEAVKVLVKVAEPLVKVTVVVQPLTSPAKAIAGLRDEVKLSEFADPRSDEDKRSGIEGPGKKLSLMKELEALPEPKRVKPEADVLLEPRKPPEPPESLPVTPF
jgi:hypothetical protein